MADGDVLSAVNEAIHIEAPPDLVWRLITDVRRHPEFAGPKSITKEIEFDGPLNVGTRWQAREKFGPQKFDAPSEVTVLEPQREFAWVSFPPVKDESFRGKGGRCYWSYKLQPEGDGGTQLEHSMETREPKKGAISLKVMYKALNLPAKQRRAVLTSLEAIRAAAEREQREEQSG